jgi:outer membrane protein assembly factor BamB
MKASAVLCGALLAVAAVGLAADCPQWGISPSRNNVSDETNLATEWNVGQFDQETHEWLRASAKNIRWVARLGSDAFGTPVVAGGKVFCATNNGAGWLARYPSSVDLGCLLCFEERDGRFLWQLSCQKLADMGAIDWPEVGICCSPLVDATQKRLWLVTNRDEVVCAATDPAKPGGREADILWRFDMMRELGVKPHNMSSCSVTAAGDLLLVSTSNGVDEFHKTVPAPDAPSFIALDKRTGKLVWADRSPGANILHGQWSSPAFAVIGGVPQAVFAGGDGWVYSFRASAAASKPELLWKFDCNPKTSLWKDKDEERGDRGSLVATPVIHQDRVYIAVGDDPQFGGQRPGCLWCIDATKRGDVSPELVFDASGKPVPPRRVRAADPAAGDQVRPNPNSAAVWHYTGRGTKDGESAAFNDTMHHALGMAAVKDDLLVIADLAGVVHCLDARNGAVHWTHDALSEIWGSPLLADGKIYIGDANGEVLVLTLAPALKVLAKNRMGAAVFTTPVAANGTLFIATPGHLVAVGAGK